MDKGGMTFSEVYTDWRARRIRQAEAGIIELATVHIDDLIYERYYKDPPFACGEINSITTADIDDFLTECIVKYNASHKWRMTRKCFEGISRVGKKVFRYAFERRIIGENPFDRADSELMRKLPSKTGRKSDAEQILTEQQCTRVRERLAELHNDRPDDVRPLAVMLYLHIGARLGEPLALTWDDCRDGALTIRNSIHYAYKVMPDGRIARRGEKEKGSTKTGKDRTLPITSEMEYILREVRKAQNGIESPLYVFQDSAGRKTERSISQYLSKRVLRPLGIYGKSVTCLRKTLASRLARITPDRNMIAQILGHSVFVDDHFYQFDMSSREDKRQLLQDQTFCEGSQVQTLYLPRAQKSRI